MSGDNGSVTARDIAGSSIVTGENNTVSSATTMYPLPPAETVDLRSELASLRSLLATLRTPDRHKLDRALQDAEEESAKPTPDKEEIAGAIGRVARYASAADDFSEHAEKIAPRVAALASWLGPLGKLALAAFGMS